MTVASCPCGRRWAGLAQAHCTICHRQFSTVALFDRHAPAYTGCKDPETVHDSHGRRVMRATTGPFGETWKGIDHTGRYAQAAR